MWDIELCTPIILPNWDINHKNNYSKVMKVEFSDIKTFFAKTENLYLFDMK